LVAAADMPPAFRNFDEPHPINAAKLVQGAKRRARQFKKSVMANGV